MTDQKYMRPGLDFAVGKAIEELGELQAAIGKTLRWGWSSFNPELPRSKQETNVEWVRREMADVRDALNNLEREMDKTINRKGGPKVTKPWIKAADDAGPLPEGAADFLSCMLIPDSNKKLITLPAETWHGVWRLINMAIALDEQH